MSNIPNNKKLFNPERSSIVRDLISGEYGGSSETSEYIPVSALFNSARITKEDGKVVYLYSNYINIRDYRYYYQRGKFNMLKDVYTNNHSFDSIHIKYTYASQEYQLHVTKGLIYDFQTREILVATVKKSKDIIEEDNLEDLHVLVSRNYMISDKYKNVRKKVEEELFYHLREHISTMQIIEVRDIKDELFNLQINIPKFDSPVDMINHLKEVPELLKYKPS